MPVGAVTPIRCVAFLAHVSVPVVADDVTDCAKAVDMRAVPLGQTDGVAVLAALEPLILTTAARAAVSSLDDLGACALMSDIAAMRHETLSVRLFIS